MSFAVTDKSEFFFKLQLIKQGRKRVHIWLRGNLTCLRNFYFLAELRIRYPGCQKFSGGAKNRSYKSHLNWEITLRRFTWTVVGDVNCLW